MKTKHTPGPWRSSIWGGSEFQRGCVETLAEPVKVVCDIAKFPYAEMTEQDANARRIVACVNACEGIDDPADLRQQRDDLLVALCACEIVMQRCYAATQRGRQSNWKNALAHPIAESLTTARAAMTRARV